MFNVLNKQVSTIYNELNAVFKPCAYRCPADVSVCFSLIIEFYLLALIVLLFCHVLGYFTFLITYFPISFLIQRYLAKVTFYIVIIQNLRIIVT